MTGPHPWDLTDAQAAACDAIVQAGSVDGAAKMLGVRRMTVSKHWENAGTKLPGETAWHKRLAWRDARGLCPSPKPPATKRYPYHITEMQAQALDLMLEHPTQVGAAQALGIAVQAFHARYTGGLIKLPGRSDHEKLRHWREVRCIG